MTRCHFRETERSFGVTRSVKFCLGMDVLGSRSTRCTGRAVRTNRHSEALLRRKGADCCGDGHFAAGYFAHYGCHARLDTNRLMLFGRNRRKRQQASMKAITKE